MNIPPAIYTLAGFVAVAIAELVALGGWWSFYFRTGIPIFRREYHTPAPVTVDIECLERRFTHPGTWLVPADFPYPSGSTWWQQYRNQLALFATPLRFRVFGRGEYGFREQLFTVRLWYYNYLPVMRGQIVASGGRVTIVGRLNLSVPALVVFFVTTLLGGTPRPRDVALLAVFLFVIGMSYAMQARRFRMVGEFLASRSGSPSKIGASRPD